MRPHPPPGAQERDVRMGKFTLTHEINCNADTFWKIFFDDDFNTKLYKNEMGFPAYELVEHKETDTTITRKISAQPKMNLPGPLAKMFGSGFSYVEEGSLNKATKVWTWKTIPSAMADKLRTEGTV